MPEGNLLESAVRDKLDELLEERDDFCECEQCRKDMIAYALSNLKPRYAGSKEGKVLLDSVDISSKQTEMDILRVLLEGAKKVKETPHHDR
ncbi:late competence development ComFB family protein [Fuchsiella alkaliacetigena]|uniref:late competence development ComFB family protein n=1 Tax=Fuchsiella alkaliacetigena TaxID=957042 RepID=UPI00200A20B7|nr:late competence development ComFB family protein [Fuchsiella alkaliacetigena]MCK8823889.1 late competence development ComFB family protein [Fuchsiella alkaliacetigena]